MCDESAIPDWFPDVIQDWSDLCKCIFELYLALLEESLRTGQPDDLMQEIARLSMDKAIALWEKRQSKVDPNNFRFYEEKVPLQLNSLVGRLVLLKHDEKIWDKILIRLTGYAGRWMSEIPTE